MRSQHRNRKAIAYFTSRVKNGAIAINRFISRKARCDRELKYRLIRIFPFDN